VRTKVFLILCILLLSSCEQKPEVEAVESPLLVLVEKMSLHTPGSGIYRRYRHVETGQIYVVFDDSSGIAAFQVIDR